MTAFAILVGGILLSAMPDCSVDETRETGPWVRELIKANGRLEQASSIDGVGAELLTGGCRLSDARLEEALVTYVSQLVAPGPVDGTFMNIAKVLAELRVRARPSDEAVRLLMVDSVKAYERAQEVGPVHCVYLFAVLYGYQVLVERGDGDALCVALSSADSRVVRAAMGGVSGAGSNGRLKVSPRLRACVIALFNSDDVDVQRSVVSRVRWIAKSAEEHRMLIESFLSKGRRSEDVRIEARRQLAVGWK